MRIIVGTILLLFAVAPLPSANARTCSDALAHCRYEGTRHPDAEAMCTAATARCMQSGVFIGPFTGRIWRGVVKN
jgi:hypothetical protein